MRANWIAATIAAVSVMSASGEDTTASKAPPATGASQAPGQAVKLDTTKDKVSYSIGADIGRSMKNLQRRGWELDTDKLVQGLKDSLAGAPAAMTDDQMRDTIQAYQAEMQAKSMKEADTKGAANKAEGDAFLAKNKGEKDVVTLPSGLQYKIIKAGDGKKPVATDNVECHYRGTLINGTEFDSSHKRGRPAEFNVSGVIRGWQEALKLMPVGSKWQLFVPSNLAYGPQGAGPDIGPHTTLIFEVELLAIK